MAHRDVYTWFWLLRKKKQFKKIKKVTQPHNHHNILGCGAQRRVPAEPQRSLSGVPGLDPRHRSSPAPRPDLRAAAVFSDAAHVRLPRCPEVSENKEAAPARVFRSGPPADNSPADVLGAVLQGDIRLLWQARAQNVTPAPPPAPGRSIIQWKNKSSSPRTASRLESFGSGMSVL